MFGGVGHPREGGREGETCRCGQGVLRNHVLLESWSQLGAGDVGYLLLQKQFPKAGLFWSHVRLCAPFDRAFWTL